MSPQDFAISAPETAPAPAPVPSTDTAAFLELVAARRGHFRLESGHHGALWLDLDALFASPRRIQPFIDTLVEMLRPLDPEIVCGPLLGGAFLAQAVAGALGADFCFTERVMPAQVRGLYQARYRLPRASRERVVGRRVAMVDDVMSAGSALRGTYEELQAHEALTVAAGALLVLGRTGEELLEAESIPVHAVARDEYLLWLPKDCPLCADRTPLEDSAPPA